MINDYKNQAAVWDWDGYDDSAEHEYWCRYAQQYGQKVLIPMCAHGKMGAYMAENNFQVTAFDLSPDMIVEGKKRFGSTKSLELLVADLLTLDLAEKNFDFAFLAGNGDLHLIQPIENVKKALLSIRKHMRTGACLVLELTLPTKESWSYPKTVFHPRVPNHTDKKIWKENEGRYDADEKRNYINQTVYIETTKGVESFEQSICLQYYERDEIVKILNDSGFNIASEYCNRQKETWKSSDNTWIVEAIAL